jgi:disulfide bond formation protein DsbB
MGNVMEAVAFCGFEKLVLLSFSFEISNMRNISACVLCVEERIFW